MSSKRLRFTGLASLVLLSFVAYGSMVCIWRLSEKPLPGEVMRQTIGWYMLAFLAFGGMVVWVERRGRLPGKWLWGAAVLFRLLFLLAPPALSSDVYRYLWDGYVANQGVSPYAYAIDSPELDALEIPLRGLANHTWMASPYLPAAQLLFWAVARLFPLRPLFVQIAMIGLDLLVGLLLVRLLEMAALPRHRAIIYLWNPLVIVEVAGNAHMDVWMALLMLAAVHLTLARRTGFAAFLAPLSLALATLTKLLPVLLLPILFWRWNWRQRAFYAAVIAVLLLPFGWQAGWGLAGDLDGTGLFGAFRIYNDQWNFNSGLFHWLERWLGAPGFGRPSPEARGIVRLILGLSLGVLWLAARRAWSKRATLRLLVIPAVAYLLFTTTVHPWYILFLLVFLPFLPPAAEEPRWYWLSFIPWFYLNGALFFSYITYLDPLNPGEQEWVRQLEWLPTLGLLSLYLVIARNKGRRASRK